MAITGKEDHRISLAEAAKLTKAYRNAGAPEAIKSHFVNRGIIDEILAQKGCAGLRLYHAKHPDGSPTLVIVGADAQGTDFHEGTIAQQIVPCPPNCPPSNPLNS